MHGIFVVCVTNVHHKLSPILHIQSRDLNFIQCQGEMKCFHLVTRCTSKRQNETNRQTFVTLSWKLTHAYKIDCAIIIWLLLHEDVFQILSAFHISSSWLCKGFFQHICIIAFIYRLWHWTESTCIMKVITVSRMPSHRDPHGAVTQSTKGEKRCICMQSGKMNQSQVSSWDGTQTET